MVDRDRLAQRDMRRRLGILQLVTGVPLLFPGGVQALEVAAPTPELATGYLVRVTLALLAVLVSIALAGRLLRRFNRLQTGTAEQFRILSAISMGPRERIVLLQIGDTQLLVAIVPGRIQTLHVLAQPIDVLALPPDPSATFPSILGGLLKRGKAA